MASLTVFAPCKINLFLEILGKRADGYHELQTIMETVDLGDELTIESSPALEVEADRADVPNGHENLAFRIVRAAESVLGRGLPARIRIKKNLPPGSGLGAGSSDAAAALCGVLELYGVQVEVSAQRRIAAQVGSDVAFFIDGGLALCEGRGEVITALKSPRERYYVLVVGESAASTREVYSALRVSSERRAATSMLGALDEGNDLDPNLFFNRLEGAALQRFPILAQQRTALLAAAGRSPVLSGSGSSFFFPCDSIKHAAHLATSLQELTSYKVELVRSHPPRKAIA